MDLNHRRAFSLLLYQLSYNRIRYSAYKANCTLSSEPRIIDKSYYVTPFGVVLPTRFQRARSLLQRFLRPLCLAFHHGSISKLSVQQSTVFPICQTVSLYIQAPDSIEPVVPKAVFETARDISRKAVWELYVYLIPSLGQIYARLSEPPLLAQVTPLLQTPCSTCDYLHRYRPLLR